MALLSLFTGRHCRADVAMTGEIGLHGRVMAVGGIAEEVRAAQRSGMRRVVVPMECAQEARKALEDGDGGRVEVVAVGWALQAAEAAMEGGCPWTTDADEPYLSMHEEKGKGKGSDPIPAAASAKL